MIRSHPPDPVALDGSWSIGPGNRGESENVLYRQDGQLCNRLLCLPDKLPNICIFYPQVAIDLLSLVHRERIEPTGSGIVVVGSGIGHKILCVVVGEVGIVGFVREGELEDLHPWQGVFFSELIHLSCD